MTTTPGPSRDGQDPDSDDLAARYRRDEPDSAESAQRPGVPDELTAPDRDPGAPGPEELDELYAAGLPVPGELTVAEVGLLCALDGGWPGPDEDPGYDPAYDDDPGGL